jgi:hypothetical protein
MLVKVLKGQSIDVQEAENGSGDRNGKKNQNLVQKNQIVKVTGKHSSAIKIVLAIPLTETASTPIL